ncbi:hypothetical protein DMN91_000103 [Ooceraea biroi]|uniref:Uncharacterized protein n=1 Tax=Ooceraea biroi TaxID=2015173 RepID=A0A3L8E283_OOCBI|nr:hypothetical protein DMN91_000103 [Ooceraea biroi]
MGDRQDSQWHGKPCRSASMCWSKQAGVIRGRSQELPERAGDGLLSSLAKAIWTVWVTRSRPALDISSWCKWDNKIENSEAVLEPVTLASIETSLAGYMPRMVMGRGIKPAGYPHFLIVYRYSG